MCESDECMDKRCNVPAEQRLELTVFHRRMKKPGLALHTIPNQFEREKTLDSKARADNRHVAGHEHRASVYVRCRDCLMFGIPMPGEFQCGNCNSHNTVSYLPPCCLEAAVKEAGRDAIIRFCEGDDSGMARIERTAYEKGKSESFSQGAEWMRSAATKIVDAVGGCDFEGACGREEIKKAIRCLPTSQPICTAVMCFCGKHSREAGEKA